LQSKHHEDNIMKRQDEIDEKWENLKAKSRSRLTSLEEAEKFYKFNSVADDVIFISSFSFSYVPFS